MKSSKHQQPASDGRAQRTIRSRQAIIEAVLALHHCGILVPTAQEVADQSGLGIRTVFRHFSEMEKLYIEGDQLLYQRYKELPAVEPSGTLATRIDHLVRDRNAVCEAFAPHIRATLAQVWRYQVLQKNYQRLCENFDRQNLRFLPELEHRNEAVTASVNLAMSFESWNHLRLYRDMDTDDSIGTLKSILGSLLKATK